MPSPDSSVLRRSRAACCQLTEAFNACFIQLSHVWKARHVVYTAFNAACSVCDHLPALSKQPLALRKHHRHQDCVHIHILNVKNMKGLNLAAEPSATVMPAGEPLTETMISTHPDFCDTILCNISERGLSCSIRLHA